MQRFCNRIAILIFLLVSAVSYNGYGLRRLGGGQLEQQPILSLKEWMGKIHKAKDIAALKPTDFSETLDAFSKKMQTELPKNIWDKGGEAVHPYVRKLVVNPKNIHILLTGDIHGSLGALLHNMKIWQKTGYLNADYKIQKASGFFSKPEDVYAVFLGDYGDRGPHSVLVLYTLLKFKFENWDKVFLLRGNHETKKQAQDGGLQADLEEKKLKQAAQQVLTAIDNEFFNVLPQALFIGSGKDVKDHKNLTWIQCCHGGIEPGFNVKKFLDSKKLYADLYPCFTDYKIDDSILTAISPETSQNLIQPMIAAGILTDKGDAENPKYDHLNFTESGFMWSDFVEGEHEFGFNHSRSVGFLVGDGVAINVLNECGLKAMFRAHQHTHFGLKNGGQTSKIEKCHWKNVLNWRQEPATVPEEIEQPPSTTIAQLLAKRTKPFSIELSTPDAQIFLMWAREYDERVSVFQQEISRQGTSKELKKAVHQYSEASEKMWLKFRDNLPTFNLANLKVPVLTLSTASSANVLEPYDSFCILKITKPEFAKWTVSVYEAVVDDPKFYNEPHFSDQ